MKRGEIYYIMSNYQEVGSEQHAGRPAVIVSNDTNNINSSVVTVAYMTTRPKADLPTHVHTNCTMVPSIILCEQICSVSKQRIGDHIATLSAEEVKQVEAALAVALEINLHPHFDAAVDEVLLDENEALIKENEELRKRLEDMQTSSADDDISAELIKVTAERDVYKKIAEDLMAAKAKPVLR